MLRLSFPYASLQVTVGLFTIFVVVLVGLACSQSPKHGPTPPLPLPPDERDAGVVAIDELQSYCTSLTSGDNPYLGPALRNRLAGVYERSRPTDPALLAELAILLSTEQLQSGDAVSAVGLLEAALAAQPDPAGPVATTLLDALSLAYLKMGELSNCTTVDGRYTCILPVDGGTSHSDRQGSEGAIATLTRLLDIEPDNLTARWLLNVAHMTLGSYPEGVSPEFLADLKPDSGASGIGRFEEVAPSAGIYDLSLAGGAVVDDFDNDGLLDIVATSWHPCVGLQLYLNGGDGRFVNATGTAGLTGQLGGLNIVQADYDNDGWIDLLVLRGGWLISDGEMRVSLLRNERGVFRDVTAAAGLAKPAMPGQVGAWADYDNDGDLDIYLCNEAASGGVDADGEPVWGPSPSQLMRNRGNGTFEDVAETAGVLNDRYCKGAAWGDYDGDGLADLYVSNFEQPNRLYRALGDGTYEDVAQELSVDEPHSSFATWWWDYDNDGDLDIYVAGFDDDVRSYISGLFGSEFGALELGNGSGAAVARLFRNDGSGGFEDVTSEVGLDAPALVMGAGFGDLDGDGFLDIVLGTGSVDFDALTPNLAYRNLGGRRFVDVSVEAGLGHLEKGHGVAFGDLDRDGDQDIFVQIGGFYPGDAFSDALYRNPGNGNAWVNLTLEGTRSARSAIGARIAVDIAMADGSVRTVYAHVGTGGSFGGSSLQQEIGLGDATRIARLTVTWPATGTVETFEDVPIGAHVRIIEDDAYFMVLDRPPVPLGSP
jgi:hypothetical protein